MNKTKVSIIGVGLIGGSLGMALKSFGGYHVTGIGRKIEKLKKAKKLKAVDGFTCDISSGVKDADIVVICTPVDMIAPMVKRILPFLKKGAVITDAGSVKTSVVIEVDKVLNSACPPERRVFVGAHPMAGTEMSGVENAKKDMYKNAVVVITPENKSEQKAAAVVSKMWKAAGARILIMKKEDHDKVVALTSHLPHVIAFSISKKAGDLFNKNRYVKDIAAGSFRDMTRIVASKPEDWARICSENKKEVGSAIDDFIIRLNNIKKNLGSVPKLERIFSEGKIARQKLLNIKQ